MIQDTAKLCVHTITTKPWPLETNLEKFRAAGVKGITVWRQALAGREPAAFSPSTSAIGGLPPKICSMTGA
jgi:hypothetical protein